MPNTRWQVLGASVRGYAHVRTGKPNQDALRWWPRDGNGPPLVLAIADGHGGTAYTRSHVGAAYAVRTAVRLLSRDLLGLLPAGPENHNLTEFKRTCEEWLPKLLVRTWQERVLRHASRYPLDSELIDEPDDRGDAPLSSDPCSRSPVESILRHYGTTLLAALLTSSFHLYLQLGDGDILTVDDRQQVMWPPLDEDDRLLGNETTSLCSKDAWQDVRLYFQPLVSPPTGLILLATDGYANSFVSTEAFEQVGLDLLRTLQAEGPAFVHGHLPRWLKDTSQSGSGDDITVALAFHNGKEATGPVGKT